MFVAAAHVQLVKDGEHREADRRVQPTEHGDRLLALDDVTRRRHAFAGVAFLVADDQLDLAAAEDAALGVDLVDGHGEAALDRLAGERGAARHRRDQRHDDWGLRLLGERSRRDGEREHEHEHDAKER
jgi:hypothetical protein